MENLKKRKATSKEASTCAASLATSIPANEEPNLGFEGCNLLKKVSQIDAKIDPVEFYEKFVKTRTPVKFGNSLQDSTWKGSQWSLDYLKERAGELVVKVERRDKLNGRFGKGNEESLQFKKVISQIHSQRYYLTTQELEYDVEGRPSIISPPVTALRDEFPLVPGIFGNLILQNANLWLGSSSSESTSGLHHDHHDNLYVLLHGRKRVVLLPPSEACNLYTVGQLARIHPNGRINYVGELTEADGSALSSGAAMAASEALCRAAERLETAGAGSSDLDEAEEMMDAALEACLEAEIDDFENDFDGVEEGEQSGCDSEDEVFSSSSENEVCKDTTASGGSKSQISEKKDPSNFSKVDTALSEEELMARFPLYVEARQRSVQVELHAGEMLYIPAGWFHEVFSSNGERGTSRSGKRPKAENSSKDYHMAFNYWFHPPDGKSFERPYKTDFWLKDWQARGGKIV